VKLVAITLMAALLCGCEQIANSILEQHTEKVTVNMPARWLVGEYNNCVVFVKVPNNMDCTVTGVKSEAHTLDVKFDKAFNNTDGLASNDPRQAMLWECRLLQDKDSGINSLDCRTLKSQTNAQPGEESKPDKWEQYAEPPSRADVKPIEGDDVIDYFDEHLGSLVTKAKREFSIGKLNASEVSAWTEGQGAFHPDHPPIHYACVPDGCSIKNASNGHLVMGKLIKDVRAANLPPCPANDPLGIRSKPCKPPAPQGAPPCPTNDPAGLYTTEPCAPLPR
jgi:hypothetical protein